MGQMRVKKIFADPENRKIMEVNVLPGKYCTFSCVFCPIEEKGVQTDETFHFEETGPFLEALKERIEAEKPDALYINSMGEAFLNNQLEDIIALAKKHGMEVILYTNGYLLGDPRYASTASLCDEVTAEVKAVTEESFQKLQRPLKGYTLETYWENMAHFREGYGGKFTVYVTLIRGWNDDEASIARIKELLSRLSPTQVFVDSFSDEKFGPTWGVAPAEVERIRKVLLEAYPTRH